MWSIGYGCCGHNGGTVILNNYTTSQPILHHANMGPDSRSPHQLFTQYPSVEPIAHYRKGGFHPIHIDDILQNRYHVVNKLGCGAYGTIWLVDDLASGRCAALKVLAAEISKEVSKVAILRHLKQRQLYHGGLNGQGFLMEFLDDFQFPGGLIHSELKRVKPLSTRDKPCNMNMLVGHAL